MVIWLFAGGGETELGEREGTIKGIVHFFEKHFPDFTFERKTPVRNKRPPHRVKPNTAIDALGKTGESLARQMTAKLQGAVKYGTPLCDVILVLDDLDCCCHTDRKAMFENTINQAGEGAFKEIKRIIGFAAPEMEAWLIADWNNTIAKHIDFRQNQQAMRDWLAGNQVSFETPEAFSFYDPSKNSCHDKLSELLVESSRQLNPTVFSKASHTSSLLYQYLKPEVVAEKCPIFRDFYTQLRNLNKCP